MNPEFLAAVLPSPRKVLGYHLEPFSAAHFVALTVAECETLDGPTINPVDLVTTLRICASPVSEKTYLPGAVGKPNGLRELLAIALLRLRPSLLFRVSREIQSYLRENMFSPEVIIADERKGTDFEGDEILARVQSGMKAGLSEFRAWSISLGLLDWHGVQSAVARGVLVKVRNLNVDAEVMAELERIS